MATRRRRKDDDAVALIVALATMGGPLRQMRTYLTRGDLPGDPLADSAWTYLWSAQNNQAFITTMGVDVHTFNTILTPFETLWNSETIPEAIFALVVLNNAMLLAAAAVCNNPGRLFAISGHWSPTSFNCTERLQTRKDCVAVYRAVQNAYYNGWTCSHYCSCNLTFAPDGTIIYSILNAPGSWHDAAIAAPLYNQLVYNTPQGYWILSDTAFPRKAKHMDQRILAPVKRGD
ncbi:hypothetical protein PCASD_21778 [Puccinia coronata f. sp. avenae]|uniref:DDE Tnp4 domain-containing protein n=1 Tax=Puccinia coronata f. sp. avenae TaxID=200324 RepID=A0A2N5SQS3_9BASI|nr:hypothetical protein PCASD_21778 [Puccinia coronata f. sp. avenae]